MSINCSDCGKFISYESIDNGKAKSKLDAPDNHFSSESMVYFCGQCNGLSKQSPSQIAAMDRLQQYK